MLTLQETRCVLKTMNIAKLECIKQSIPFSECSWNHEYLFRVPSKVKPEVFTLGVQDTRRIHEYMNIAKLECIKK